jgi:VIT1/CCC1 family predicted Fe2+/Mn2+ transporter
VASSEYLSTKSEGGSRDPLKASLYTGTVYILTVSFLIFPFLISHNHFLSLAFTLLGAILVLLVFSYYLAVAKDIPFGKRFLEMAGISLGIAGLSFFIGYLGRIFWGQNL